MGFLFLFQEFPLRAWEGGREEKQLESFAKMTQSCLAMVQELTKQSVCLSLLENLKDLCLLQTHHSIMMILMTHEVLQHISMGYACIQQKVLLTPVSIYSILMLPFKL